MPPCSCRTRRLSSQGGVCYWCLPAVLLVGRDRGSPECSGRTRLYPVPVGPDAESSTCTSTNKNDHTFRPQHPDQQRPYSEQACNSLKTCSGLGGRIGVLDCIPVTRFHIGKDLHVNQLEIPSDLTCMQDCHLNQAFTRVVLCTEPCPDCALPPT